MAGSTLHFTPNIHMALEYFHAYFQWYKPVPAPGRRALSVADHAYRESGPDVRLLAAVSVTRSLACAGLGAVFAKVTFNPGNCPGGQLAHPPGGISSGAFWAATAFFDRGRRRGRLSRASALNRARLRRAIRGGGVTADAHRSEDLGRGVFFAGKETHFGRHHRPINEAETSEASPGSAPEEGGAVTQHLGAAARVETSGA